MVIVSSQTRGADWLARELRRLGDRMLRELCLQGGELGVLLVSDRRIRALNHAYRGKDRATDVLSFPMHGSKKPKVGAHLLGDVVISVDTLRRQARVERRPLVSVGERLLVHGVLHLLGYDHEGSPAEARRMARRERALAAAIRRGRRV